MSVPKKRRTRSSAGKRRSHHSINKINLTKCPKCGQAIEPHKTCLFCGNYKNREVIKIKDKSKGKKQKK